MLVQGTKILHSVTPVLSAKEDRISFVNSYGRRDVFAEDRTRFSSMMAAGDPEEIYELEYARHKAWRVMGQMKHVVEDMPFGTSVEDMAALSEGVFTRRRGESSSASVCMRMALASSCIARNRTLDRLPAHANAHATVAPQDGCGMHACAPVRK